MDRSPWLRPVAGSSNQRDSGVAFLFGGTPSNNGVCGDKDDTMDSSPWLAPVQTRSVIENLPKSSAACCLNIRDTVAALDSSGTSHLRDVGDPVKLPPFVSTKVRSPLCWTSNNTIEATRDVNHASNNASAACIKSLPYRVLTCESVPKDSTKAQHRCRVFV
ncbi:hypothetical protein K439DRAFT_1642014 [Ramaria rubella]|nr:hypothetical protein K439DRAFT_1642014 [Ramaria rubella]